MIPLLGAKNEAIYERADVKRGGADFVERVSRTSPFAVGFGRSGPSQTCPPRSGCATRDTSSEPEAEGDCSPSIPAVYDALADVT
jgi:hypothetical protein